MLNKYFEKIFVINLSLTGNKEIDTVNINRMKKVDNLFSEYDIKYSKVTGIYGAGLDTSKIEFNNDIRWNVGAYGLVLTTINILEEAIENNYENILIFEDDIEFHHMFRHLITKMLDTMPPYWDIFFLGVTKTIPQAPYNHHINKLYGGVSCHAYAINKHMYKTYLDLLKQFNNPIDVYTNYIAAKYSNTYTLYPNMVYQYSGYSNIEGKDYDTSFTK